MKLQNRSATLWWIGVGIVFPLFFQLVGAIYRERNPVVDSLGVLATLPLPISIVTCLVGLIVFRSTLERASVAIAMIGATVLCCGASILLGADGVTSPTRKMMMMVQVCLPFIGFALGQMFFDRENSVAKAFLAVVAIVVPVQLVATWVQGELIVTHYLYAFSIYSHLQYVTLIFVCAYGYALTHLWVQFKWLLIMLGMIMFIYVTASSSFLTIIAFMSLIGVFFLIKLWHYRRNFTGLASAGLLLFAAMFGSYVYFKNMDGARAPDEGTAGLFHGKFKSLLEGKIPANVQERFGDWELFGKGIVESSKTMLVGHPQPMPREIRSSPHNWYIEMLYTFGLVSLIPIIGLIIYTSSLSWRQQHSP